MTNSHPMTDLQTAALQALLERVEYGDADRRYFLEVWPDKRQFTPARNAEAAYLGSLDAAAMLHEAVLPGRGAAINLETGYVAVYGKGINGRSEHRLAGNIARAWLIAIIRALIATPADTEAL